MSRLVEIMSPGPQKFTKDETVDDATKLWLTHEFADKKEFEALKANRERAATMSKELALRHMQKRGSVEASGFYSKSGRALRADGDGIG